MWGFFPQRPNSFSLLFSLETNMYFTQFPLNSRFLRIISTKIKSFFCLFTQFYMDLSDKYRMKDKWSLTTMILNNLDLWIPAPLCTDLAEEMRNLGLVVRQGGCWTRSICQCGFHAFQAAFLLLPPAEEVFPQLLEWMNCMLSLGHQSVFSCLFW